MKKIFLFVSIFWLMTGHAQEASKTVVYKLDTLASDSFYLVEKIYQPSLGGRVDTFVNHVFFRDTASFGAYYRNLIQLANGLSSKIDYLTAERDSIRSRGTRLAVLSTSLSNFSSNSQNRQPNTGVAPKPPPANKTDESLDKTKKKKKKKQ